jgi:hypothetical protein
LAADRGWGWLALGLGMRCVPWFHRANYDSLPFKTLSFKEGLRHG